jgi:hypothetical protein
MEVALPMSVFFWLLPLLVLKTILDQILFETFEKKQILKKKSLDFNYGFQSCRLEQKWGGSPIFRW